jgi:rhodanese-related sulfurtransferase
MEQLTQFVINHWILAATFVAILLAIAFEEMRHQFHGGNAIKPQELVNLMNHDHAVVVDIRDAALFHKGHILSALNLHDTNKNHDELIKKMQPHKQKPIVLVDNTGTTATLLATKLRKQGFEKVKILSGGITAWRNAGLPLKV